jgi:hypothetical protein
MEGACAKMTKKGRTFIALYSTRDASKSLTLQAIDVHGK